jgi:5-methylcytosine-specific restriction endonuclease McrA
MRLCRCGAIVKSRCSRCDAQTGGTTAERGYDNRWRELSERKRKVDPLCEQCDAEGRTTAASEVHHIRSIRLAPQLRLEWSNLMSVCADCHKRIERSE